MSFRNVQENSLPSKTLRGSLPGATYLNGEWVRNPSWLPLASITSSDQKFTGLYQINRYSNFISLNFTTSGGAQYSVDWGDGSAPQLVNSGTQANYEYDFNDVDLAGTDGPVTFTDSTDTVNRTAHGYQNGMTISFATIVTTTGIVPTQIYYVVNAATDSFQVSATQGGSPIALTTDGSGTILPFKQAVVTVTPVSGNFTVANLNVKHPQTNLQNGYITGWLDVAFAGNFTTVTCQGIAGNVQNTILQQINVLQSSLTSYASLFNNLFALCKFAGISSTATVTNTSSMFVNSANLTIIELFNTANVTNMTSMFQNCTALETLPLFNTGNVTSMNSMFNACPLLKNVPLFNTGNVTDMGSMFISCSTLENIPPFNTANVTSMNNTFQNCFSLKTLPLLNTANVTSMNNTFQNCFLLETIPLWNTIKVTSMSNTFNTCTNLQTIPLFDTGNVTNMTGMFAGCNSFTDMPLINTAKVTTMTSMFTGCSAIQTIPLLNTANVTNMTSMFNTARSFKELPLLDTSKVTSVNNMFRDVVTMVTIPLLNTVRLVDMSFMFFGCRALETIPLLNTSNVTSMNNTFANASRLFTLPLLDTSKVTDMTQMLNNNFGLQNMPLFNTSNVTSMTNMFSIFSGGASLKEVPAFNCKRVGSLFAVRPNIIAIDIIKIIISFSVANASLSSQALNQLYTNLPKVGGSVTFQGTADTVTISNHGYVEGDTIRFSVITTTTGIGINTTYTVRNPTTDTFQLSVTDTGAIINLVNDGTGTRAPATITVTGNYGTATDDPTIATNKGWTVTGS